MQGNIALRGCCLFILHSIYLLPAPNGLSYWRAGVDSVREQGKLEARKILDKSQNPHSPLSSVRRVHAVRGVHIIFQIYSGHF
jgi:hypothetical protein